MAIFISVFSPVGVRRRGIARLRMYITFHILSCQAPQPLLGRNENAAMSNPGKTPATFVDDYLPALLAQASHLISGEFPQYSAICFGFSP